MRALCKQTLPFPTISIVLPTYNRSRYLRRAIESALKQTRPFYELIIVDDGSEKPALADSYNDKRIRVSRKIVNEGVASARNRGIEESRGEYIAFLDDDDELLPSFIAATSEQILRSSSANTITWTGHRTVRESSSAVNPTLADDYSATRASQLGLFEAFLSIGTGFGITVRREIFARIGAFNTGLKTTEDTDWFFRALLGGYLPSPVPGVHMLLHSHDGPRLSSILHRDQTIAECDRLLSTYSSFLDSYPRCRIGLMKHMEQLRTDDEANGKLVYRKYATYAS